MGFPGRLTLLFPLYFLFNLVMPPRRSSTRKALALELSVTAESVEARIKRIRPEGLVGSVGVYAASPSPSGVAGPAAAASVSFQRTPARSDAPVVRKLWCGSIAHVADALQLVERMLWLGSTS